MTTSGQGHNLLIAGLAMHERAVLSGAWGSDHMLQRQFCWNTSSLGLSDVCETTRDAGSPIGHWLHLLGIAWFCLSYAEQGLVYSCSKVLVIHVHVKNNYLACRH